MYFFRIPGRRLNTCRLTLAMLLIIFSFIFLFTTLYLTPPSPLKWFGSGRQTPESLKLTRPPLGSFSRPVYVETKKPPPLRQDDDAYANSSWLAHPNALSELFSEEITMDKKRALLPYLHVRQPIYCYYDAANMVDVGENDTDTELLLMWRRAWWARGFKPFILGLEEAKANPLYTKLESMQIDPELKKDLLRWLAFDTTNGGLLSHHMLFPMGPERDLLPFLRRGEYFALSRSVSMAEGLFWGTKEQVHRGVRMVLASNGIASAKSILDILDFSREDTTLDLDVAFYNTTIMAKKYSRLFSDENKARSGKLRNQLINAHLQSSWQNIFFKGIDIIEPFPEYMSTMIRDAEDLAYALAACPPTPLPGSCPPNIPRCGPCGATTSLAVRTTNEFKNKPNIFTIGVVPHPWTRTVLARMDDDFNATWIRESPRDSWITLITEGFIMQGQSRYYRLREFKNVAVGGGTGDGLHDARSSSLWYVAEDPFPPQLEWRLGFAVPKTMIDDGRSESPVPSDHIHDKDRIDLGWGEPGVKERAKLAREADLLERARVVVVASPRGADAVRRRRRASLEAWNMADTEAWKVVRGACHRRTLERELWERESKYTERQRLLSEDAWTPGMAMSRNSRKLRTQMSKHRD